MDNDNITRALAMAAICTFATGVAVLAGCSSNGTAQSPVTSELSALPASSVSDYGWVAFRMPEGWVDACESDDYETIIEEGNPSHMMRFSQDDIPSEFDPTADDIIGIAIFGDEAPTDYSDGSKQLVGGYEWTIVDFELPDTKGFVAYTAVAEKKCMTIAVSNLAFDDPAVQTVLASAIV